MDMTDLEIHELLRQYAAKYETRGFLEGDPSCFMHKVKGDDNQEAMAFIASGISYGSRKQFIPKIEWMRQQAAGEVDEWIRYGKYASVLPANDDDCFYRMQTKACMHTFLHSYQLLMEEHYSLGNYLRHKAKGKMMTASQAVEHITSWFALHGSGGVIPKNTTSACKRVCMFLRWMVRTNSPVDLGLWNDFIDRSSLIMPLDTHVMQQSCKLGLLKSRTTSMSTALHLSEVMKTIFPGDPLQGDFALFGYGVNNQ